MQGQDIALLNVQRLGGNPLISPSEVSKSLKRSAESSLLHIANGEKRVNRSALIEFLSHGFKYVFPPAKGSMAARGVPTNASAEPLKSRFVDDGEHIRRNDVHNEH
jgi:hypothetical protein